MLNRYIGNKSAILKELLAVIGEHAEPGGAVCDVFSGSLAVSVALKRAGYRVFANDVNVLSYAYGTALISNDTIPEVDLAALAGDQSSRFLGHADEALSSYRGREGYAFLDTERWSAKARSLMAVMLYLGNTDAGSDLPREFARSDIFDHYCEHGSRSAFTSARGRQGRRRFFSRENAQQIDRVVNHLRFWRHRGGLSRELEALLLTVLLDAVERVANTQGTYHDFPREQYDPRALRPMRLELPALDGLIGSGTTHLIGRAEDSLEFVKKIPPHDVLYVDPPYNFRQYTAYYFLPNLLCKYPSLADPKAYFAEVRYVRGQNMADDFSSSFSSARTFIPSLRELIDRALAKTVVLSYFDGRNHWNDFKSECNGEGYRRLTEFFSNGVFVPKRFEVLPISRLNYQSYGGYKAKTVSEYLFVGHKR